MESCIFKILTRFYKSIGFLLWPFVGVAIIHHYNDYTLCNLSLSPSISLSPSLSLSLSPSLSLPLSLPPTISLPLSLPPYLSHSLDGSAKASLEHDLHSSNHLDCLMVLVDSAPQFVNELERLQYGETLKTSVISFTSEVIPHMEEEEQVCLWVWPETVGCT